MPSMSALLAPTRSMSPEEVLDVLIARSGRLYSSAARWTNETTIVRAFGLFGCLPSEGDVLDGLNEVFATEISEKDFSAAVRPARKKTLGELCQLISMHALVPRIEPWTSESALQVIFAILLNARAEIPAAGPAAALEPYLRKHYKVFENQIVKLGGGRVPPPTIKYPRAIGRFARLALLMFIASCGIGALSVSLADGSLIDHDVSVSVFLWCCCIAMASIGFMMAALGMAYAFGYAKPLLPGLETFGDLASAVVGESASFRRP